MNNYDCPTDTNDKWAEEFEKWLEENSTPQIPTVKDAIEGFEGTVAIIDGVFYNMRKVREDENLMATEVADWHYHGNIISISTLMYYLLPSVG